VARDLRKRYLAGHGRCWAHVQVLASVSLTLQRGERLAIVGARGSGKTTLLHCLTGLRRLDGGSVRWDGSAGAPYRLCGEAATLRAGPREGAALVELPDDSRAAGDWLDALHARHSSHAGWLVLAARLGPLPALAHRVLELRDGVLRPLADRPVMRVAEG
jgi:energy-coupling factor transporter ATP-binding protein EcfA2